MSRDVEIAQRLTNVFFGSAEGVAVRGVDEVDAAVYGMADDPLRSLLINGPLMEIRRGLTEAHAAKAYFGYLDAGPA